MRRRQRNLDGIKHKPADSKTPRAKKVKKAGKTKKQITPKKRIIVKKRSGTQAADAVKPSTTKIKKDKEEQKYSLGWICTKSFYRLQQ